MANSQDHIRQWKHNRSLLAKIPAEYPDWIVTFNFYVALQAVDALLAHDKVTRVTSHESRNDVLMRTNRYRAIKNSYLPLWDLSRTVRYLSDPTKWIPADQIGKNVLGRYLYPIENSVQRLMAQDIGLSPITLAAPTPVMSAESPPPTSGASPKQ